MAVGSRVFFIYDECTLTCRQQTAYYHARCPLPSSPSFQAGRISFDLLLERSYWGRQHRMELKSLGAELRDIERKRAAIVMGDLERAHCLERSQIEASLAAASHNARKGPQRALEQWKNGHAGPKWTSAWAVYQGDEKLEA